jgi:hypothetical protein
MYNKEANIDNTLDWLNKMNFEKELKDCYLEGLNNGEFFIDDNHMINQHSEFIKKVLPIINNVSTFPEYHIKLTKIGEEGNTKYFSCDIINDEENV